MKQPHLILAVKRNSRSHSTAGFCENVAVTEESNQMLGVLSFNREG